MDKKSNLNGALQLVNTIESQIGNDISDDLKKAISELKIQIAQSIISNEKGGIK